MKVLLLTRYGPRGASSRYRSLQYVPHLERNGVLVDCAALLDDQYLSQRYQGGSTSMRRILDAYGRRVRDLLRSRSYDLIWLEKEALPWLPGWLETTLLRSGPPYIVDYDDATFHSYDQHESMAVRRILGRKIDRVMSQSAVVVVGNQYLADHARFAGARKVEVIPTVVDLHRYPLAEAHSNKPFTVGWIGTPITTRYLEQIRPALSTVCRDGDAQIVTIGAAPLPWPDVQVKNHAWDLATEVELLQSFDVGIMPLPDSPFERGKCGLKLIQYMACAAPVIASPVGVNREIVQPGINGFLATTETQWIDSLERLKQDRALGRRMGETGRRMVEERFSLQVTAPRILELFRATVRSAYLRH